MAAKATKRRRKPVAEPRPEPWPELTAAVVRVLKRSGATSPDNHIRSVFFRDLVFCEVESRIDWDGVREQLAP
jgi:hypothetical protein